MEEEPKNLPDHAANLMVNRKAGEVGCGEFIFLPPSPFPLFNNFFISVFSSFEVECGFFGNRRNVTFAQYF